MIRSSFKMTRVIFILFSVLASGCFSAPPSKSKADWYAIIEMGGSKTSQKDPGVIGLQIKVKFWVPLLGPDGPGGPREGYEFYANLRGEGPVYRDPELGENGLGEFTRNRGTITIDRKTKKVTIDLQRIVSKPGEPEKLESSRANGTYPIKRWVE